MSNKPVTGTWVLIDPEGREYQAESPLKCCRKEIDERVPVKKQLENLHRALFESCDLCGDEIIGEKYTLGDKECPAYLYPLCEACHGTILARPQEKLAKTIAYGEDHLTICPDNYAVARMVKDLRQIKTEGVE